MHRALSLFLALFIILAGSVASHEVRPAIADLTVTAQGAELHLSLNIEAVLAGIDLDNLRNTDESALSGSYDSLRRTEPAMLQSRVETFFRLLSPGVGLFDGTVLRPFKLISVTIDSVGDPELPRDSQVTLWVAGPIAAATVALDWPKGFGAVILRQIGVEDGYTGYLSGGDTSPKIPLSGQLGQTAWTALRDFIPVGFEHIIPKGLDHILFVLGLYFLSVRFAVLMWQISAFTVAHTVTLALGAFGLVSVPATIVEPLIAASIVFIAIENIASPRLQAWRPLVVFGFGLLHGLGFASVLGEFGLPDGQFVPALIGFNIGVELGQLTVIAVMILSLGLWFSHQPWFRARIAMPASALIGLIGAWWCVERTLL